MIGTESEMTILQRQNMAFAAGRLREEWERLRTKECVRGLSAWEKHRLEISKTECQTLMLRVGMELTWEDCRTPMPQRFRLRHLWCWLFGKDEPVHEQPLFLVERHK